MSGTAVLTSDDEHMGRVTDVVLDVTDDAGRAVGYEVRLGHHGAGRATVLLPVRRPSPPLARTWWCPRCLSSSPRGTSPVSARRRGAWSWR
ncbi:PRC-barrel domain-containing protein [Streptomyces sp. NBC_01006]|uniref:PRC-barrel domain-containing protein n=1 Tax=Streptomyces sp. NBC_01006 TaxID=2903716 RepID=UPI0038703C9D